MPHIKVGKENDTDIKIYYATAGRSRRALERLSADEVNEAAQLYRQGLSLAQLGDHFHVDPKTVWNVLRKAGVSLRPRPGWR